MTRPRSTTSQADELGAILSSIKARVQAVELLAHTPCSGGGGGGCPCPENVLLSGDTMTGFLTLNADPTNPLHASTKQYADTKVSISGDTMTGFLTLSANPTSNLHATTKQYADTADNLRVLKSGDTMTGSLTITGGSLSTNGNISLTGNATRITQNSTATWSGGAGTGFGKLEYHSNRWYINAGSDSAEIVRFRRGESDLAHMANDGRLNLPHWTTSGRNNSNEWIQFNNHSGLFSPLNGAHFYPNNGTYGSWRSSGSRNTWGGIEFDTFNGQLTLMTGAPGAPNFFGWHHNGVGWRFFFNGGGLSCGGGVPIAGNNTGFWGGAPAFGVPAWNLMGSYQFFNPSDTRFKLNQRRLPLGLSFLKRLEPIEYTNLYPRWIDADPTNPDDDEKVLEWEYGQRLRSGLRAQEVRAALDAEGAGDYSMWSLADKDDPDSFQVLDYREFIAPLINAVQELDQRITQLEE